MFNIKFAKFVAILFAVSIVAVPLNAAATVWTKSGTRGLASQPNVQVPATTGKWQDYNPAVLYPKTAQLPMQYITLMDGTRLAAYVTLPADANGNAVAGQFPTVLVISDYSVTLGRTIGQPTSIFLGDADPYIVQHGYATVSIDARGTGNSNGTWDAWGSSQGDYSQIVTWVTQQGFTNGSIAVRGASDLGIQAMFAAGTGNPAIKAVFAVVPMGDSYRDTVFPSGVGNLFFMSTWLSLTTIINTVNPGLLSDPAQFAPVVLDHLQNAFLNFQVPVFTRAVLGDPTLVYDGPFWTTRSPIEKASQIKAPTFIVGSVHDVFQRGEPLLYEQLKNRVTSKLVIWPGTHIDAAMSTISAQGSYGLPPFNHVELQWYDRYLKGIQNGADQLPAVTQYVIGQNKMATSLDWPSPAATPARYYLQSGGTLTTSTPPLLGMPRSLFQTPFSGVCSISTAQWSLGILGLVPLPCLSNDQATEAFNLVYETAPFAADHYINGPIEADIWMSTTGVAGTLSVRVDDVDSSGTATPISNGLMSLSGRAVDTIRSRTLNGQSIQPWHPFTLAKVQAVVPNIPMKVPVEIFPTSALLKAGHKLRVAVGPSNLPEGVPTGFEGLLGLVPGVMTVYSDSAHPSSIVVPQVPGSSFTMIP